MVSSILWRPRLIKSKTVGIDKLSEFVSCRYWQTDKICELSVLTNRWAYINIPITLLCGDVGDKYKSVEG